MGRRRTRRSVTWITRHLGEMENARSNRVALITSLRLISKSPVSETGHYVSASLTG